MATSELHVKKLTQLGEGSFKIAFTIDRDTTNAEHNFTIPVESDVANFCLVEYADAINWRKESNPITYVDESFKQFRTEMENNPQFKYDIEEKGISLPYKLQLNKNLYGLHKDQINCIAELKKMHELAPRFAPVLHQIRIDIVNSHGIVIMRGTPFPPEEMDSRFAEIPSVYVKVSYLIERCGNNVIKHIMENPDEKNAVAQKIIEFVDSYVDTHIELLNDIKSENFCTQIVDGKIELIRMLDVDPKYSVKCDSPDPAKIEEFKRHAKVFMKYAFIIHSIRWGDRIDGRHKTINFVNLNITQDDLDAMLAFFYEKEYMIHEYNPINMLYHYFIQLHPSEFKLDYLTEYEKMHLVPEHYEFLSYDRLKKHFNSKELFKLFKKHNKKYGITLMEPNMGEGGGGGGGGGGEEGEEGEKKGGRKKQRKSKKRVNKKRKRTRKN